MGKFFAAAIMIAAFVKLGPMCARLPDDLTKVSGGAGAPAAPQVAVDTAAVVVPPAATAPVAVAKAESPKAKAARPAVADEEAVVVANYSTRKMFKVADGKAMISVSVRNVSDRAAKGLRLTTTAHLEGKEAAASTTMPFEVAASSSLYRGMRVTTETLDALLAEPAKDGTEMRWDLRYTLEGDPAGSQRCYRLRSVPRVDGEGVSWKNLEKTRNCAK